MKKRIWELDALRGLCVLGVVAVHLIFDLVEMFGLLKWQYPLWFRVIRDWGGVLFLLISGICVTLGSHHIRRGLIVLAGGLACTLVTWGMYRLGLAWEGIIIYFGVLHCLGCCMLLWAAFRRMPTVPLALLAAVMVAAGLYLRGRVFAVSPWLAGLGLVPVGFASSDYFPLLPNLGFFLLGAVLGRTLYRKKQTLLPQVNERQPVFAFLQLCGRQSLWIYLLHQPILYGICLLLDALL